MAGTSQLATPVAARLCLPHGGSSTCARKGSKVRLDARGRSVFAFGAGGRRPSFWRGCRRGFGCRRLRRRRRFCLASTVASTVALPSHGGRRWRHDRHGRRGVSAGASGGRPASSSKCVPGESHARGGRSWVFAAGRGFTARPPTAGRKVRGRRWRACCIAGGAVWLLAFTFVHSCSTFVNVRNS